MRFFLKLLGCCIAVGVAAWLVPGISLVGGTSAWMPARATAVFLSLINVSLKPILRTLGLPITVLTFGIFALIINALMLELASALAKGVFGMGLYINSFGAAFVGSIVISIVSVLVNALTGADEE